MTGQWVPRRHKDTVAGRLQSEDPGEAWMGRSADRRLGRCRRVVSWGVGTLQPPAGGQIGKAGRNERLRQAGICPLWVNATEPSEHTRCRRYAAVVSCARSCAGAGWMAMEPKHHIAVVDDEPDLRSSVAEYLQLQGYTVSQAGGGPQLRAMLASEPIDLVLLDLRMPGEDGLTVLRGVREHFGVPVIMVTALGDPIDRIVGLEVGADDYVVKPFEFRELLARIRTVLRRAA